MYNILSEEFDIIKKMSIGLIFVVKDHTYYLLDQYGEISESYSEIDDCGYYVSYVKLVDIDHCQYGKINAKRIEFEKIDLYRTRQSDGYYTCEKIEKDDISYGYVDKDWNVLIPFIFSSITPFRKDVAKVYVDGQVALINKTILASGEPHFIIKPFNGKITIYRDRRFVKIINYDLEGEGIVDILNEFDVIKCAPEQRVCRLRNEDVFIIKNSYEELISVLNRYGQEIIPCKYKNILIIGQYICLYQDSEEYIFYSKAGTHIENVPSRYVKLFHERLLEIEDDYYQEYNDETLSGCGEGWSCSNCPHVGCPANELN